MKQEARFEGARGLLPINDRARTRMLISAEVRGRAIFRQVSREMPSRFQRVVLKNRNRTPDYRERDKTEEVPGRKRMRDTYH